MAGCKTKKYAEGGMVRGGANPPTMPRVSRMPPQGMQNTGRMRVAGPPPNAPPMAPRVARMPPAGMQNTGRMPVAGPPANAPMRGFKKGGFVSKVKPSGGRGTKSCKIC